MATAGYDRIGSGDLLRITIFERDGLGLFTTDQSGAATFDTVLVGADGAIQLPYLGRIAVDHLSLGEAHALLLLLWRRINRLALASDVQIGFAERHSQLLSVEGDVLKSGLLPRARETGRVASLLGVASLTLGDIEQALVTMRRGTESVTVRLSDVFDQSSDDIALQPGDLVVVRTKAETINFLGAAGLQGRLHLVKRNYSVMDAAADARGLSSDQPRLLLHRQCRSGQYARGAARDR